MKAIKKLGLIFLMILILLSTTNVFASEPSKAYVVPIKGEINRATHNYVRDVVNDLNNMDVEAIIFEIDTYGGVVDEAIKIKDIIYFRTNNFLNHSWIFCLFMWNNNYKNSHKFLRSG